MSRRDAVRAIAKERVYGPGPTPGSRTLLAKPGQPIPQGVPVLDEDPHGRSGIQRDPASPAESTRESSEASEVPESIPAIRSYLEDATDPDELARRVALVREAEEAREQGPRATVVKLCERFATISVRGRADSSAQQ